MSKRLTENKNIMAFVKYKLNQSHKDIYRRRFRVVVLLMASLIVLVLFGSIKIYDALNSKEGSQSPVGKKIISNIAGPKLFKNQFFEFYSSDDWRLLNEGSPNKIGYAQYSDGVVAASFVVYVNQTPIPDQLKATMALPVSINGNSFSKIGSISEPCGQTYAPNALKVIKEISISSTSMLCQPDSSVYTLIVGQVGGDYNLKMVRSSGQVANYIIIYTSSSFIPSAASFMNLIPTFKSL